LVIETSIKQFLNC